MRKVYRLLVVAVAMCFVAHCSGGSGQMSKPVEDGSLDLGMSLAGEEADNSYISINKSALGEEYILHTAFAQQREYGGHVTNPTKTSLKSRIVIFEESSDGRVLMLEADGASQPGDEYPPQILITSFPIKESNGEKITFDFNRGMQTLLLSLDWYTSDPDGTAALPDEAIGVRNSYIERAKINLGAMTINQVMNVVYKSYVIPVEVTYYLAKYEPNPDFIPVEFPGLAYLGYFENNAQIQEDFGVAYTYITRWDISGPITYYISQAFPEEYRDAVGEGVLYWNKVFGKEVFKVALAPENLTAPDFERNMIQWHTDHFGGFAYADAQMDPRTGEILHAQIFIPSSFTEWSVAYDVGELDRKNQNSEVPVLSAKEFNQSRLCELHFSEVIKDLYLYRDQIRNLSTEQIKKYTKDYLRQVIAHEVGHTLGLRHNFMASTVNEWSGEAQKEIVKHYFREGMLPEGMMPPINSVMDYTKLDLDIIIGAMILRSDIDPFSYDNYAIHWGYYGGGGEPEFQGHPFCTDSHVGKYTDCDVFDTGMHPVERNSYNLKRSFEKIPHFLVEAYISSKANFNPKFRRDVFESTPTGSYLATRTLINWRKLVSLFVDEINLRSAYYNYPDLSDIDLDMLEKDMQSWLNFEIAGSGGIDGAMLLINPEYFKKTVADFMTEFDMLVNSGIYNNIPLYEGGSVSFTEEEIAYMRIRAAELFPAVEEEIVSGVTQTLLEKSLKMIDLIEEAEFALSRWAEFVITSGNSLDFRYKYETRRDAVLLLNSGGPLPGWLVYYIPPIAEKLREQLEEIFGMPLEEIDVTSYPRRDQESVAGELSLYYMIASKGNAIPGPIDDPEEPVSNESKKENRAVNWIQKLIN